MCIAQRLGLPRKVIKNARSHIDDQHRALSQAIEGTLDSRRADLAFDLEGGFPWVRRVRSDEGRLLDHLHTGKPCQGPNQ